MRAGLLDHKISLQHYTESLGSDGHPGKTWSTYATVWARLRTLSGHERIAAEQVRSTMTHEITIRYYAGVQPGHRVLYGTRTWDIKDVRNIDEQDIEIRMRCIEVPSQGPSASASPSSSISSSPSTSVSASPSASPSSSPS